YSTFTRQFVNINSRMAAMMPRKQFPRLVAFFGNTGMGKSTIIKTLIRHLTSSQVFDVPVVGGGVETHNSTSSGIHIYTDPKTFTQNRPIVYVGMSSFS